jgi:hypothetical protein
MIDRVPEDASAYIDPPFRRLCREVASGHHGELVVEGGLRLRLLSYEPTLFRGSVADFRIETEDGMKVTLLDCVPLSWGAHELECAPNQLVRGQRFWEPNDTVRFLSFSFWGAREALHYNDHVDSGLSNEEPSIPSFRTFIPERIEYSKLDVLTADCETASITVGLNASLRFDRFQPGPRFKPSVRIDFRNPINLDSARRFARHVLTFFELSVGVRSRMLNVRVSTQTLKEQEAAVDSDRPVDDFEFRGPHDEWTIERAFPGCAAFPVHSEAERKASASCLAKWLERIEEWEPAYALASMYIAKRRGFDRDRLMRLASWFEALPMIERRSDVTKEQRMAIAEAAQARARELGRSDLEERIGDVLGSLGYKALRQQIGDVASKLRHRFGKLVPEGIEKDLRHVAKLRNDAAHGRIALDESDPAANIAALRALELVCFLAMLHDLPVTPRNVENNSLAHYILSR